MAHEDAGVIREREAPARLSSPEETGQGRSPCLLCVGTMPYGLHSRTAGGEWGKSRRRCAVRQVRKRKFGAGVRRMGVGVDCLGHWVCLEFTRGQEKAGGVTLTLVAAAATVVVVVVLCCVQEQERTACGSRGSGIGWLAPSCGLTGCRCNTTRYLGTW